MRNETSELLGRPIVVKTARRVPPRANLYSLVETAKANGLDPWRYLTDILKALPAADSIEN